MSVAFTDLLMLVVPFHRHAAVVKDDPEAEMRDGLDMVMSPIHQRHTARITLFQRIVSMSRMPKLA
jgi:hypothetical protein